MALQSETIIWRDSIDDSFYGCGVRYKNSDGQIKIGKWFDIHVDGICDMFGSDAAKKIVAECAYGIMAIDFGVVNIHTLRVK